MSHRTKTLFCLFVSGGMEVNRFMSASTRNRCPCRCGVDVAYYGRCQGHIYNSHLNAHAFPHRRKKEKQRLGQENI